jgi:glycosyltransferase involved in cell wall biosynthesis
MKVFVPTWNSERTLEKCLTKIEEAIPKAEIYIFDKSSIDKTQEIARSHGAQIVIANGHIGETRSEICRQIAESKEWAALVDSDIYLPPSWLNDVSKYTKSPDIGAVFGQQEIINEPLKSYSHQDLVERRASGFYPAYNFFRLDASNTLVNPKAVAGFSTSATNSEDYALGRHIHKMGYKYVLIEIVVEHDTMPNKRDLKDHLRWNGAGQRKVIGIPLSKELYFLGAGVLRSLRTFDLFPIELAIHNFTGYMFPNRYFELARDKQQALAKIK